MLQVKHRNVNHRKNKEKQPGISNYKIKGYM